MLGPRWLQSSSLINRLYSWRLQQPTTKMLKDGLVQCLSLSNDKMLACPSKLNFKLIGANTLFWDDKKGMTKLKSIVVIPKLWSGYFLCERSECRDEHVWCLSPWAHEITHSPVIILCMITITRITQVTRCAMNVSRLLWPWSCCALLYQVHYYDNYQRPALVCCDPG